ncbi:MAG: flagellar hook capping FlgD N-terminal domain-containing protein [Verrucomicrobiota bacterium]|jgi:flagellar basal-body rod modification protein FlgD
MSVSSITANASTAGSTAADATAATTDTVTNPNSELNQTDFLQLLVAQMQYQDPMNPQSDTDMAAQMAQFSSLQEATQSNSSLSMMQANSLVGSTVTVQVDSTDTTSGVVTGVVMNDGAPEITVGGTNYELSQVTAVSPTSTTGSNAVTDPAGGGSTSSSNTSNTQ